MKKFISLVLSFVLILSFGCVAFGSHSSELDALNNIDYYVYWIFSDFTDLLTDTKNYTYNIYGKTVLMTQYLNSMTDNIDILTGRSESVLSNLVDINDYSRQIFTEVQTIRKNLFGELVFLEPFANTVTKTLNEIRDVLADEEDLALKESQKDNQQAIQDSFFNPDSETSVSPDKIGDLASLSDSFIGSFDFSDHVGNTDPFSYIGEGSEALSWFSAETGKDIDPTFSSSSGGGTTTPPSPSPEEPIVGINILPYAESEYDSGTIFNGGLGYKNNFIIGSPFVPGDTLGFAANNMLPAPDTYSSDFAVSGFIDADTSDVFYFYNVDIENYIDVVFYTGAATINSFEYKAFRVSQDINGVYKLTLPTSLSTSFKTLLSVRFVVSSFNSDSIVTKNEYPFEGGEPEPIINLLPNALEFPGLNSVLGDNGFLPDTAFGNGSSYETLVYYPQTGSYTTGFMPYDSSSSISISSQVGSGLYIFFIDPSSQTYSFLTRPNRVLVEDSFGYFHITGLESFSSYKYFCLLFFGPISDDFVITQSLPFPSESSTFSLRSPRLGTDSSSDIVTNYVEERNNAFLDFLGVNK